MEWLVDLPNNYETEQTFLSKLDKVTLYDHNFLLKKNMENSSIIYNRVIEICIRCTTVNQQ